MNADDLMKEFADKNNIDTSNMISVFDMFDNAFMSAYKLNDAQYDYICEHASNDELDLLIKEEMTYNEKREAILIVKKYKELHATDNSGFDF